MCPIKAITDGRTDYLLCGYMSINEFWISCIGMADKKIFTEDTG